MVRAVMKPGSRQVRGKNWTVLLQQMESLKVDHSAPDNIKTLAASTKKHLVFWRLCFAYHPTTLPSFPASNARKELPSSSEQNRGGQPIIVP